jgi:hypothetical protein
MNATVVENAPPVKGESILTAIRRRAAKRRWRETNREKIAAGNARYYRANQQRILQGKRDRYAEHREERQQKRRAHYRGKRERLLQLKWRREFIWNYGPIRYNRQLYGRYVLKRAEQFRWAA